jgi:hypothetical protein
MSSYGIQADQIENDPVIEQKWAMKAIEEAEAHYRLITSTDSRYLKMTS